MKKLLLVPVLLGATFLATSVSACPPEQYRVHQLALDANGVVTRSEYREVPAADFEESQKTVWKNVVVDRIKLESGDEVLLNAAPGMMDASVHVLVKRSSQTSDPAGVFHTTYTVRETMTSGWGGETTRKLSLVTVKSNYLGNGKRSRACGGVSVKRLPNSTIPAIHK